MKVTCASFRQSIVCTGQELGTVKTFACSCPAMQLVVLQFVPDVRSGLGTDGIFLGDN